MVAEPAKCERRCAKPRVDRTQGDLGSPLAPFPLRMVTRSMTARPRVTVDGNEAVANVAHQLSEVIAIYPITPSSGMGELCDEWASHGRENLWGHIPTVTERQ